MQVLFLHLSDIHLQVNRDYSSEKIRRIVDAVPQVKVNPLVKGDGVAISSRLPIAGNTRLHQQSLSLIIVIGCHLGRQRGSRHHGAHPFAQDGNPYVRVSGRKSPLTCDFLYY